MARPPETRLDKLAQKFEEAYTKEVNPQQPEDSISVAQYAKRLGIGRYAASNRLIKMVEQGVATRERFGKGFVYRLVKG